MSFSSTSRQDEHNFCMILQQGISLICRKRPCHHPNGCEILRWHRRSLLHTVSSKYSWRNLSKFALWWPQSSPKTSNWYFLQRIHIYRYFLSCYLWCGQFWLLGRKQQIDSVSSSTNLGLGQVPWTFELCHTSVLSKWLSQHQCMTLLHQREQLRHIYPFLGKRITRIDHLSKGQDAYELGCRLYLSDSPAKHHSLLWRA